MLLSLRVLQRHDADRAVSPSPFGSIFMAQTGCSIRPAARDFDSVSAGRKIPIVPDEKSPTPDKG
jgi:hypothetical protein